jgi:hypothetical protein
VDFFKNFLARPSLKAHNNHRLHLCNERGGYMIQSRSGFSSGLKLLEQFW